MKRIINVLVLTCALNFIFVLLGGGLLLTRSHMDREKFAAVKKLLFETSQPTTMEVASTQPVATTEPADRLAQLLAENSGLPAGKQIDFIRQTFNAEMAELDRRQRELQDLSHQIELSRQQTKADREKLQQAQKALADAQEQQRKLASNQGFQDSLELYNAMAAKQVKTIFMTLDDDTVVAYLDAMEPRVAAKIIKEFKLPEETTKIQKVLEKIRTAQQGASPGTAVAPVAAGQPQASLPR